MARVQFQDPYRYKRSNELVCAAEGMYSGQFIYAGKKAALVVGNILPLYQMPEGTLISFPVMVFGFANHVAVYPVYSQLRNATMGKMTEVVQGRPTSSAPNPKP